MQVFRKEILILKCHLHIEFRSSFSYQCLHYLQKVYKSIHKYLLSVYIIKKKLFNQNITNKIIIFTTYIIIDKFQLKKIIFIYVY